jgi:hypothetical protein
VPGESMADIRHSPVTVLRQAIDDQRRASRPVAFVLNALVGPGPRGRAIDGLPRDPGIARLLDRQPQAAVGGGIGPAGARRESDLASQLGGNPVGPAGPGARAVLDVSPLAVACHVGVKSR